MARGDLFGHEPSARALKAIAASVVALYKIGEGRRK